MGFKKTFGGFLGLAAAAGAVAVAVKYLVDYTDFKNKAEKDFHDIEEDTGDVKQAAKRTYTSLSTGNTSELKEAARDLAGAAGRTAASAGNITFTAGQSAAEHVKDTYAKYKEDPEATKTEVIGNFKDIAKEMGGRISDVSKKVADKVKGSSPSDIISDIRGSVADRAGAISETVNDFKDEYRKNLDELEQKSDEKKAEIENMVSESLKEEAKKHETDACHTSEKCEEDDTEDGSPVYEAAHTGSDEEQDDSEASEEVNECEDAEESDAGEGSEESERYEDK